MKSNCACLSGLVCLLVPFGVQAQAPPVYTITTVAGDGTAGYTGDGSTATTAELYSPFSTAMDKSGNLYIADQANNRVRMVTPGGTISTVAGNGTKGYMGDGAAATSAELSSPEGVAIDSSGNLYISDTGNNVIRKVSGSNISTFAGENSLGPGYSGDGGAATAAQFNLPAGIAFDSNGNLYIADSANNAIRKVSGGNISTVAGNGTPSYQGDGGVATSATLWNPEGVALDSANNLYIADTSNSVIRKVTTSTGIISTVAGTITSGFSGDEGPAVGAQLHYPDGVAVDASGNIYIADRLNSRIRMVLTSGIIVTIAGEGGAAYSGDGGPATNASLFFPTGVMLDGSGNVYVTDNQNEAVRKLIVVPGAPSIQPGGIITATDFGGAPDATPGTWLEIYGSNLASTTRGWTQADFHGDNAPTSLNGTYVTIDGAPAYVAYISPSQVNVQVPLGLTTNPATVTVMTGAGTSAPYEVTLNLTQPGLLAPPSFKVGGNQYVVALFPDGKTYVAPTGAIAGVTSKPASVGDTITLYGVGFGPVSPYVAAGQIAPSTPDSLTAPFQIFFGKTPAALEYSGLAPGIVGLYQFNVVVPNVAPSNLVPLSINLNGDVGTQKLYTAVQ